MTCYFQTVIGYRVACFDKYISILLILIIVFALLGYYLSEKNKQLEKKIRSNLNSRFKQ